MKQILIVVLAVAAVALAVVNVKLSGQVEDLRTQLNAAQAGAAEPVAAPAVDPRSDRTIKALEAEVISLSEQLDRARHAEDNMKTLLGEDWDRMPAGTEISVKPPGSSNEEKDTEKKNPFAEMMSGMAEMMESEEMQGVIRMQAESQVDMNYGPLMDYMNLDDEQKSLLRALLLDRQMSMVSQGMSMFNSGGDPVAADEFSSTREAYDEKIRALLGEENYATLEGFEQTEAERMQVQTFKMGLSGPDALSLEQERELVQALYEERSAFDALNKAYDTKEMDMDVFSEARIAEFEAATQQLVERQVQAGRNLLSPSQFTKFEAHLRQHAAMQLMGMKMAGDMMESGEMPFPEPAQRKE